MTHALRHRGPDAENIYVNGSRSVGLGHTRLSIIDLSSQANQPMHSADGRFVVVFNGEIYNFKKIRKDLESLNPGITFHTSSDTEIILAAFSCWGVDMVTHLGGMFAIAIYDTLIDKLFLFRDRVGKKPLYYFSDHRHFIFASEIKSLLNHPAVTASKEVDMQAVHEFLHLGYIPEPKTIYRSIRKFPAGHVAEVWNNLSFSLRPYWKAEEQIQERRLSDDDSLKKELRLRLHNSVQQRLISDVPLGVFLSGGTDSSLVTAIAKEYKTGSLKTFSIGFKESTFDEHHYASQVASLLKTDHHEYILSESEAAGMLETYLHQLDEPFADTSAIPTLLVSQLAKKEVTVALTGDGGDELFLGYGTYTWAQRISNPAFRVVQTPLAIAMNMLGDARFKRVAHLLEKTDRQHLRSHIFSQEQYFFSDKEIHDKLLKNTLGYEPFRYEDPVGIRSRLGEEEKQALFDLKYYLKDDLLVKVDRASMFHSLECRCPLLDHDVIEFALNAPVRVKRRKGTNKWILKELLADYLPHNLVHRPKWGFSIPLSRWLKNEFHYLIDQYLNEETVTEIGLFDPDFVASLKHAFMNGEEYLYNRIWILVVLHKWLRENE